MSVQLPPRPQKGQPISPDYFLQMWDYLRSLEPHGDLRTTVVNRQRSGTTISAPRQPTASPPSTRSIIAEITFDNEDGTYEGTEQKNTGGSFADADAGYGMVFGSSPSQNGLLRELNGMKGVPIGKQVHVFRVANGSDGGYLWYFANPLHVFPVLVSQVGGVAGDEDTQCSFTYDVTSLSAVDIASAASPIWARPAFGAMVAATHGTAYVNTSGATVLYQVDEVPDVEICPTTTTTT
jgi:hypothetical protein